MNRSEQYRSPHTVFARETDIRDVVSDIGNLIITHETDWPKLRNSPDSNCAEYPVPADFLAGSNALQDWNWGRFGHEINRAAGGRLFSVYFDFGYSETESVLHFPDLLWEVRLDQLGNVSSTYHYLNMKNYPRAAYLPLPPEQEVLLERYNHELERQVSLAELYDLKNLAGKIIRYLK